MTHLPSMPVDNLDRVLVGDCIELMNDLPEGSVDICKVVMKCRVQ